MSYQYTSTKMSKIKDTELGLLYTAVGNVIWYNNFGKQSGKFFLVKHTVTI